MQGIASEARRSSEIMINEKTLSILRCPKDRSPLRTAEATLVAQLNSAIAEGWLCNQAGITIKKAIDGGLIREAGDLLYPIVGQIPVMLFDEAIPLEQLQSD